MMYNQGLYGRGAALWHIGRLEEAEQCLREGFEIADSIHQYPFSVCGRGELGCCYLSLGKVDKAEKC
jgi:tetratricopeptide (TPR) repeat protein